MREIFATQPKPREIARRRKVTLTVSLIAHTILFSLVAWLALHAKPAIEEEQPIAAFFVPAAPAPPPPAGNKAPEPKPEKMAEPTAVTPAPTTEPTQVTAEPPSTTIYVAQSADPAGVLGGVAGGTGVTLGAPVPAVPSGPVRVGGDIKAPALTQKVPPEYPKAAQQAHVEGAVVLEAQVREDGRVESVKVIKSVAMLDNAAIAAVKQWRYKPLMLNGAAAPFILTVTVTFDLG